MPAQIRSLLDLKSLSIEQIQSLFSRAAQLSVTREAPLPRGETLGLLFFEPSTRTRFSFETAAHRMGLGPLLLDGAQGTSLEKGETLEDTVLNIAAMGPKALVIRANNDFAMDQVASQISMPIVNAGWGVKGHPTQALLDALTLKTEFNDLARLKVLFVGDVKHSRVVASHFELLEKMGVEVGLSGPEEFLVDRAETNLFKRLEEGLEWCDAVMTLRVQFERHDHLKFSQDEYRSKYGLNRHRMKHLRHKGIVMHPGPINYGIEIEKEVMNDSRVRVLKQVSSGVVMREAILRSLLEGRL